MSEGYAQKFYVSKELSRLNDTLTREINEVKFSMAQMDDCCLRKDPSETEPVAVDYIYDEKFSDIDEEFRDIYERINFRKRFRASFNLSKLKKIKIINFKFQWKIQQRRVSTLTFLSRRDNSETRGRPERDGSKRIPKSHHSKQ